MSSKLCVPQQCGLASKERAEKCEKLRKRWRNSGPPESACRGRLQTTLERHWLKTVVVSIEGEGVPLSTSGMNQKGEHKRTIIQVSILIN
jgi:hypothetical protein